MSKASVDTVPRKIAQTKMSSFRCANHSDEPLDAKKCVQKRLPHFFVSHLHSTKTHSDVFICAISRDKIEHEAFDTRIFIGEKNVKYSIT